MAVYTLPRLLSIGQSGRYFWAVQKPGGQIGGAVPFIPTRVDLSSPNRATSSVVPSSAANRGIFYPLWNKRHQPPVYPVKVKQRSDQHCTEANSGDAKGFVVAPTLGPVDALEVFLYKLGPQTLYNVYVGQQRTPIATFKANPMSMANGTAIGPMREVVSTLSTRTVSPATIFVMEGDGAADPAKAVQPSSK